MLRTYQPITDPIFELHEQLHHLVCNVWCDASDLNTCKQLIPDDFETIYNKYDWLNIAIDSIYEKCKDLTLAERTSIREAFNINNRIEELCNGTLTPISLDKLPAVVTLDMKPLLKRFYYELLDRSEVSGNKLSYYNALVTRNKYKTCPCCGLSQIESAESHYREDNDHYLPVSDYPFACVNFNNLAPLCGKCNKKCKGTKNPFSTGRISFYPFGIPVNKIDIEIKIVDSDSLNYLILKEDDIQINFNNNPDKISTWNWLFKITKRYNEETRGFSKTELRVIANRIYRNDKRKSGLSYHTILDDAIDDYRGEIYDDRKFLKVPFLESIRSKPDWMAVYNDLIDP
jgi:hypothetical protein